jgi:predicted transcriptional regulator
MWLLTKRREAHQVEAIVLAVSQENADALLDGKRTADHRALPPTRLPARAYLAVVGTASVVGECVLGERAGRTAKGWTLPVTKARRYRKARPLADFGLAKTPRSFRYVEK